MKRYDTFTADPSMLKKLDLAKLPPSCKPLPKYGVPRSMEGKTGVIIATGTSLSQQQLDTVRERHTAGGVRVFTLNNTYQVYPDTDVHLSCDGPWWRWYSNDPFLMGLPCAKWTWYPDMAEEFGINYIFGEEHKSGLSLDPRIVHINHGSGPMIMNLAVLYGCSKLVLIGHDMKFAEDYDPKRQNPGSIPRHYFGEYPKKLQHWPSVKVRQGILDGLIEAYRGIMEDIINRQISVDVVNCTPDSALDVFRRGELEKEI